MLELVTGALVVPLVLAFSVPLFIYLYVILRWRAGGAGEPGLGSYSLVLTFRTLAILLGTGAVATLLYTMLSKDRHEELSRACWGLLLAAAVFGALHIPVGLVLKPNADVTAARRLFGGALLTVPGLICFGALVFFAVSLLEKLPEEGTALFERRAADHREKLKAGGSWLFCFAALYLGWASLMARSARNR